MAVQCLAGRMSTISSTRIPSTMLGNEKKSLLVSPSALASFEGSHVFFLLLFSLLSTGLYIFPFFRVRDVFLGQLTRRSNKGGSDRKRTSNWCTGQVIVKTTSTAITTRPDSLVRCSSVETLHVHRSPLSNSQ